MAEVAIQAFISRTGPLLELEQQTEILQVFHSLLYACMSYPSQLTIGCTYTQGSCATM